MEWQFNGTFSQNKIKKFTEYVDNWDYWSDPDNQSLQISKDLGTTDISFSPEITFGNFLTFNIYKGIAVNVNTHYVGKQYIDNTSNDEKKSGCLSNK